MTEFEGCRAKVGLFAGRSPYCSLSDVEDREDLIKQINFLHVDVSDFKDVPEMKNSLTLQIECKNILAELVAIKNALTSAESKSEMKPK